LAAGWEELKTAVTVARTGASDYSALAASDIVSLTNTATSATLTITFDRPLSGETNAIRIAAGALVDQNGTAYDEVVLEPVGLELPSFSGTRSSRDGDSIDLSFDEYFTVNNGGMEDEQFLRNAISISHNGGDFEPLWRGSIYYSSNSWSNRGTISISYDDNMPILSGSSTRIKIAAGALIDSDGHPNDEVILADVTPPAVASAVVSNGSHDVTIAFDEPVYELTNQGSSSGLADKISLLRGGPASEKQPIGDHDTVAIVDGKLVIHYAKPLSGTNNLIVIDGSALKDAAGNHSYDRHRGLPRRMEAVVARLALDGVLRRAARMADDTLPSPPPSTYGECRLEG